MHRAEEQLLALKSTSLSLGILLLLAGLTCMQVCHETPEQLKVHHAEPLHALASWIKILQRQRATLDLPERSREAQMPEEP